MARLEGIRRMSVNDVQARFSPTARWMQRLGAWRSRRLDVTPALLEEIARDAALSEQLLRPAALPAAGQPFELEQMAAGPDSAALALVEGEDGWQLLALAEELEALAGWGESEPTSKATSAVTAPPGTAPVPSTFSAAEAALVFGADEVSQLKVAVLAGTDDTARREALRRIALSGLAPEEKGLLYLVALREGGDALRAEAATQLGALGMRDELVKAFRLHASGDPESRRLAFERLGTLADQLEGWEETIATGVLASLLAGTPTEQGDVALVALTAYAPRIACDPALLAAVVETIVVMGVSRGEELARPMVGLAAALVRAAPPGSETASPAARLLEEARSLGRAPADHRARALLLAGISRGGGAELDRVQLARELMEELGAFAPLSAGQAQIELGLIALTSDALTAIGERLVAVTPDGETRMTGKEIELISLVDRLVKLSDDAAFAEVAATRLAAALATAPTFLASAIRQSATMRSALLQPGARSELASLVAREAHLEPDSFLCDEIVDLIGELGGAAVESVLSHLEAVRRVEDTSVYLEAMGRAALSPPIEAEAARRAMAHLTERFLQGEDPGPELSLAAAVFGRLAGGADLRSEELEVAAETLRAALWRTVMTAGAIEGLGHVAVAAAAALEERVAIADLLLRLLSARLPAALGREREVAGTIVYDLDDGETYTARLPALVAALERTARSPLSPAPVRARIVDALLERWEEVADYRVIWGPANVHSLALALADISMEDLSPPPPRRRLLAALARRTVNLSIAGMLARAGRKLADERELDDLFGGVAACLLDHLRDPEVVESLEDREQALAAVAALLGREKLEDGSGRDLRDELISALKTGARDRVPGAARLLNEVR